MHTVPLQQSSHGPPVWPLAHSSSKCNGGPRHKKGCKCSKGVGGGGGDDSKEQGQAKAEYGAACVPLSLPLFGFGHMCNMVCRYRPPWMGLFSKIVEMELHPYCREAYQTDAPCMAPSMPHARSHAMPHVVPPAL